MLEAVLAMGLLAVTSAAGGIAAILIADHLIDEANKAFEEEEGDYIIDSEGNKIAYNEEDQE